MWWVQVPNSGLDFATTLMISLCVMPQFISPVYACFQRPALLYKSFCVRTSLSVEQIPNHLAIQPCYRARFLSVSVLAQDSVSSHVYDFIRSIHTKTQNYFCYWWLVERSLLSQADCCMSRQCFSIDEKKTSHLKAQSPSRHIRERFNVLYWYQTYVGSCGSTAAASRVSGVRVLSQVPGLNETGMQLKSTEQKPCWLGERPVLI